jgi:hypothetical protein
MSDHPRDLLPYAKAKSHFVMQTEIGEVLLKACYEVPRELPPEMAALLMQIYAIKSTP